MAAAGEHNSRTRVRRVSLWDRAVEGKVLRAGKTLARPLGGRGRRRASPVLLLGAILTAPPLLLLIGGVIGARLDSTDASLLILAATLGGAVTALTVALNPRYQVSPPHIALQHLRTAPFRRAAAGQPGPLPDLRHRTSQLRERLGWPLGSGFGRDPLASSLFLLACMAFLLVGQAGGLYDRLFFASHYKDFPAAAVTPAVAQTKAQRQAADRILLIGFVGASLLLGVGGFRGDLLRRRAARRFQTCCCPDCGYGLGDMPPAIPPEQLGGFLCGPPACPECGSPWPLIPPPTRQEAIAAASRNLQPTLSHPITRPPRRSAYPVE